MAELSLAARLRKSHAEGLATELAFLERQKVRDDRRIGEVKAELKAYAKDPVKEAGDKPETASAGSPDPGVQVTIDGAELRAQRAAAAAAVTPGAKAPAKKAAARKTAKKAPAKKAPASTKKG